MSGMAKCRFCAEEVPADSTVCPQCQAALPFGPSPARADASQKSRWRLWLVLGAAAGLILAAVLAWRAGLLGSAFGFGGGYRARVEAAVKAGQWDKGAALCKTWAQAEPKAFLPWYYLARCKSGLKQGPEAAAAVERYLQLNPEDARMAGWLKRYKARKAKALRRRRASCCMQDYGD